MALLQGHKQYPIAKPAGWVAWGDPTTHPLGIANVAKNVRYFERSVATRYGIKETIVLPDNPRINGLAMLTYIRNTQSDIPLIFGSDGKLYKESPVGSEAVVEVTPSVGSLPSSAYMQAALAFNNAYLSFSDLKTGLAKPYVFNGNTGNLDPVSSKLFGAAWQAGTHYQIGEMVTPSTPNGHLYRCTVAGTSHASIEPTFPTSDGGTVTDNGITWTEYTPNAGNFVPVPSAPTVATRAGEGSFAAGRDVYIVVTLVNGIGETAMSAMYVKSNTALNDRLRVSAPAIPGWMSGLSAPYAPTGYNVYEADVAHSASAPTSLLKVAGGPFALNATCDVDAAAAGSAGSTTNTASIAPAGHICSGDRALMIIYRDRNGNQIGVADAGIIEFNVPASGLQLFVGNIPIGPSQTADRILSFTIASGYKAGPFKSVRQQDTDPNGVTISSTVIPNNTDTFATLDFTDVYLADASDDTDTLLQMEVPEAVDIYFSPSLRRIIYTGAVGYESGHLLSMRDNPGRVRGGFDVVQVSESDGYRAICWRETQNGEQLSFKENGCYQIDTSAVDPADWAPTRRWEGHGPVGARALALSANFLIYVHTSGIYRYPWVDENEQGLISREMQDFLKRVNWAYKHLISVHIDEAAEEVRIALPIDDSSTLNATLTLNYHYGWQMPVKQGMFGGEYVGYGRRWSLDDGIKANQFVTANRSLATPIDARVDKKQILVASSLADGRVNMIVPDQFNDNGDGIDFEYQPGYCSERNWILQFGGIQAQALGAGELTLISNTPDGDEDTRTLVLPDDGSHLNVAEVFLGNGVFFGVRFTNGGEADNYVELSNLSYWARPLWPAKES